VNDWDLWLAHAVVPVDALDPGSADLVILGELNHFVHEKTDFRLTMANHFVLCKLTDG
jgi:hypothetical protein